MSTSVSQSCLQTTISIQPITFVRTFFWLRSVAAEAPLVLFVEEEVGSPHQCHVVAIETQVQAAVVRRHLLAERLPVELKHVALQVADKVAVGIAELSKVGLNKAKNRVNKHLNF